MTNNDLLNLYNLEKSSYDTYGTWRTALLLGWLFNLILNISSNFYDSKKWHDNIFGSQNFCVICCFCDFDCSKRTGNKRVSQIMKMLLNKKPII